MANLYNLVRVNTATTGSGTLDLGSAVTGYLSFITAEVTDEDVVSYGIREGNSHEVGRGTYSASGSTLTRSVLKSTNSGSPITLAGSGQVYVTALAEDILPRPGLKIYMNETFI
jgi:hypothetical protein